MSTSPIRWIVCDGVKIFPFPRLTKQSICCLRGSDICMVKKGAVMQFSFDNMFHPNLYS